ncbi:dimethylarginine dimethylaminohydrolase family protein [Rhizosaccharibacter radicis]|uniref:Arginine deiminase-related protein n=1 Tax=Rhizosaccharibacter radicis TaxID=2782605 RepID=A0ABT1VUP3_9PROT|nr:arginine deiminase-related protein [Acetobacteraceae bacterium KSS12]
MTDQPRFLLVDPAHFEVSYRINPWMEPGAWAADADNNRRAARRSFGALADALRGAGAVLEIVPGTPGLPDMVFPANAGVVLDGRVIVARFAHPERADEEARFLDAFAALQERGLVREVATMPSGALHEGAGDAIWDANRGFFWAGHGQRSNLAGAEAVGRFFGRELRTLRLVSPSFYHLDTCFCPLSNGHVLYYPDAFDAEGLDTIRRHVAPEHRIEATREDAEALCVNAVNVGRTVVMARAPEPLRRRLSGAGYEVREVDLAPFILSGGAAYCMTLRLDRAVATEGAARDRLAALPA